MEKAGLYLHVPFCRSKCPYCDFYSLANGSLMQDWLDGILSELLHYRERFGPFDTIYLGGGTPSLLLESQLGVLMDALFHHFHMDTRSEITIETNPRDLTGSKVESLKKMAFNRVNVGVQSFKERELSFLGRRHGPDDGVEALSRLRTAGFDNVGVDLIYGLPGQRMESWLETLEQALFFRPEHISCYQLTIEKGTPFWRMKEKGNPMSMGEKKEREFFVGTSDFLRNRGYVHYEVSNFARSPQHVCRHNEKYWQHIPYLGLGPSAHSFLDGRRWWNVRSVRNYCRVLKNGGSPVEGQENLTREQMNLESVALGLRTWKGFDRAEIRGSAARQNLADLEEMGFLTCDETRVVPTREGFLLAEHLPLYLCE
jgi:putative oxygen-independent coproporphyrinogen III oxidase